MIVANTPAREILSKLESLYKDIFSLEYAIYSQLRGPHNRAIRKEIAEYLGKDGNYNVVELADLIRAHFDLQRLF